MVGVSRCAHRRLPHEGALKVSEERRGRPVPVQRRTSNIEHRTSNSQHCITWCAQPKRRSRSATVPVHPPQYLGCVSPARARLRSWPTLRQKRCYGGRIALFGVSPNGWRTDSTRRLVRPGNCSRRRDTDGSGRDDRAPLEVTMMKRTWRKGETIPVRDATSRCARRGRRPAPTRLWNRAPSVPFHRGP